MRRLNFSILLSLLVVACNSDSTGTKDPGTLSIISGDNANATVDTDVSLSVKLARGTTATSGETVTWTIASGNGSVTATSTTGTDGVATATWRLGKTAGAQSVKATVGTSSVTFNATANAGAVTSVTVNPTSATVVSGTTTPLQASATDAFGNVAVNAAFTWSSASTAVATVTNTGLVTGKLVGDAVISAKVGTIEGKSTVHVTAGATAGFTITPSNVSFASFGETAQLTAALRDAAGNPLPTGTVTWLSSNGQAVEISSTGLITARANGESAVTATSGSFVASINVSVQQKAVAIDVQPLTFYGTGGSKTLVATVKDAKGNPMSGVLTFASSDESVVTVDAVGRVIAVGYGTATITARFGTLSGQTTVRVINGAFSLDTIGGGGNVEVNQPAEWLFIPRDENGASIMAPVTVTSSDTTVLKVLRSDLAPSRAVYVGLKAGTVTLTAKSGDATVTKTITVSEGTNVRAYPHDDVVLSPGATLQLSLKSMHGLTLDAYTGTATWTSSNGLVASVSADGLVTANQAGVAFIPYAVPGITNPPAVKVTVTAITGLYAVNPILTVGGVWGSEVQIRLLGAQGIPAFSSANNNIATVTADGIVRTVAPGQVNITVSDGVKSITVQVLSLGKAASIAFANPTVPVMRVGQFYTPEPQAFASDGTPLAGVSPPMISSDPNVITIFGKYVYAAGPGTAIVTATMDGVTKTFTVEVR